MHSLPAAVVAKKSRLVEQPIYQTEYVEFLGKVTEVRRQRGGANPKIIDMTVKSVCKACNNGWMADMEAQVKPVWLRLLADRDTATLTRAETRLLARWAAKTVLMYALFDTASNPFTADDYKRFYDKRQPVAHTRIWVGQAPGKWAQLGMRGDTLRLGMATEPTEKFLEPKNTASFLMVCEGLSILVHYSRVLDKYRIPDRFLDLPDELADQWRPVWPARAIPALGTPMTSDQLVESSAALRRKLYHRDPDGQFWNET